MTICAKLKENLRLLTIPLILIGVYLSMVLIWKLFSFPPSEELVIIVTDFFNKYGLWIVFVSALIEGFLLLGLYFPGGFVIFLGVISSAGNFLRAVEVVSVVSIAFFISYILNYVIGKYGWYKLFLKFGLKKSLDNAQTRLNKYGLRAIIFSYWEPNLASITATAAGVLKLSIKKFVIYSLIGIVVWNTFWGFLVFKLGEEALKLTGLKYIAIIFFIWIIIILIVNFIKEKSKKVMGEIN
ncbi:VTT domain-containing protein [Candidatus Pacearchaeota archaeon]|nr:VTT domain-containing protein [Candidatus Pacearchaeota archaeon]